MLLKKGLNKKYYLEFHTLLFQVIVDMFDEAHLNTYFTYLFHINFNINQSIKVSQPYKYNYYYNKDVALEVIWTVVPTVLLACIAIPSLSILNRLGYKGEIPDYTINITGRQWFWEYEHMINNDERIQKIFQIKMGTEEIKYHLFNFQQN